MKLRLGSKAKPVEDGGRQEKVCQVWVSGGSEKVLTVNHTTRLEIKLKSVRGPTSSGAYLGVGIT